MNTLIDYKPVMLSPRGQSGLEVWPRGQTFGLGLKDLASAWPRSRCLTRWGEPW